MWGDGNDCNYMTVPRGAKMGAVWTSDGFSGDVDLISAV
jgi:hypothetical protein